MDNKKLTLAIATALAVPMAAHAEVKLSGTIQAEAVSWEAADGNENARVYRGTTDFGDDHDRQMLTNDAAGAVFNEGPNGLQFDIEEKLGGGLNAFARYAAAFNTSGNTGLDGGTAEAFVGLGTQSFSIRYGTMVGAYKASVDQIDPWLYTSLQASGTAGGMTGDTNNQVTQIGVNTYNVNTAQTVRGGGLGLTNEGFVKGALDAGVKFGGFEGRLQGVVDDTSVMDGAGLIELKYSMPGAFAVWLAGAYTDLDDVKSTVGTTTTTVGNGYNWKIGGNYQMGSMMTIGLQYEDAELGAFDGDINPDGGKYIMGSLDLNMSNVTLAGWIANYRSDIEDAKRINSMDEDALSWALGAKYHFSKRTQIYAGYRQTDSDNDYRDENVITMGIRHTF